MHSSVARSTRKIASVTFSTSTRNNSPSDARAAVLLPDMETVLVMTKASSGATRDDRCICINRCLVARLTG